jgi:hypothetical protein
VRSQKRGWGLEARKIGGGGVRSIKRGGEKSKKGGG